MSDGLVTYRGTVYPWQCDHVGHLNVMWYVGKLDEATWNLFAELGMSAAYFRDRNRGMAAVQQNITYKREVFAGETVRVRTRVLEVREKVIRFVHTMETTDTREVAALCELTGVHLDRVARRSIPLDAEIAEKARALIADA